MKHTLFIYGTLMPGLRLEAEMHGARFVGPAHIAGRLIDVGRYPGLLQGDGQVTGEVYEVDDAHLARSTKVHTSCRISIFWYSRLLDKLICDRHCP